MSARWPLKGTERTPVRGFRATETPLPDLSIPVSILLAGMDESFDGAMPALLGQPLKERRYLTSAQLRDKLKPDPKSVEAITAFAYDYGVPPAAIRRKGNLITLEVRPEQIQEMFGASLKIYRSGDGEEYRGREGALSLPKASFPGDAAPTYIRGIFGLDNRRQARRFASPVPDPVERGQAAQAAVSFGAPFPPSAYGFPPTPSNASTSSRVDPLTGAGQQIAVVGFGGLLEPGDIAFLPQAQRDRVSIAPTRPVESMPGELKAEIRLDLCVIFACAPEASVTVYGFDATDQGWIDALNTLVQLEELPSVVSISFGWPEIDFNGSASLHWTEQTVQNTEALLGALAAAGVTVIVSSGDQGVDISYPGSSGFVLSCGGTAFLSGTNTERVWSSGLGSSGGGVSSMISAPLWQKGSSIALEGDRVVLQPGGKRCLPDVASLAAFSSRPVGSVEGTSVAAPLWAGLIALANQYRERLGLPWAGNFNHFLYQTDSPLQTACNDVLYGTNGQNDQGRLYRATPQWDACTGWGSPRATAFVEALASL